MPLQSLAAWRPKSPSGRAAVQIGNRGQNHFCASKPKKGPFIVDSLSDSGSHAACSMYDTKELRSMGLKAHLWEDLELSVLASVVGTVVL